MKINLITNGYIQHAELLENSIRERISIEFCDEGEVIELCVDSTLGDAESYQILKNSKGWTIIGTDKMGLFYGIGKFLHSANWNKQEFVPVPTQKLITPSSSFRAIYFAIHFYNWYQMAPTEELEKYLEELLLWGYNTIVCIIPVVNLESFEDTLYFEMVAKVKSIFTLAKKIGMRVGITINPNQGFKTAPHEFNADLSYESEGMVVRGTAGRNLCPAKDGVIDYMRNIWMTQLNQFLDIGLDYLLVWPYDEGGCGCDECRPWGAKGYSNLAKMLYDDALQLYPNIKYIISTWLFDTPYDEGEYDGLYERLKGDLKNTDYIMVDAHDTFPRYPLEHDVVKPVVNFPEISMWKLVPWGGRGANPMPRRFQGFWNSAKHILKGGMPYSEGMYEDILKIQCVGYYWEADRTYQDILGEYANYEYSSDVINEVLEMMELIEDNHVGVANGLEPDMDKVNRALMLAEKIDSLLDDRAKKSWRWRILYIRARLDQIVNQHYMDCRRDEENALYDLRHTPEDWLADNHEAQELLQELCRHYHCVSNNGENMWTLPPVKDGIVLN